MGCYFDVEGTLFIELCEHRVADLVHIADYAVGAVVKYRSVRVGVDGDDGFRVRKARDMVHGAGDTEGNVQLRLYDNTRLADNELKRQNTAVKHRPRAGKLAAETLGKAAIARQSVRALYRVSYADYNVGIGYIQGYGLKHGAVATSISHDSHNIIVVGTSEKEMAAAANRVVEMNGGIVVLQKGRVKAEVRLEIAGIMSEDSLICVNEALEEAKAQAFALGVSKGIDPFMTLSFMSLPVIPTLRLTTRGVFDVSQQKYV